ncbi:MAG: signal peptidase I [Sandaracinaceae bacterium]|nr:signal peptidase I [Sandaracinaceae bacterium]
MRDFLKSASKFLSITLLLLFIAGAVVYGLFMRLVMLGHNAMAPTIVAGDRVLVWSTQSFELGDVALCMHPGISGRYVMGRVVGRQGHHITMERGQLRIEGSTPARDQRGVVVFHDTETDTHVRMQWGVESLLDHDHPYFEREGREPRMRDHEVRRGLFLLSDNRTYAGEDSRSFGDVDPSTCVGRVFMRLTAAPAPEEIGHGPLDILE